MYDSFYELKGEPFRLSPDHNMAFEHKRFAKARAYMAYAFMRAEGFVMVTGRPGTGKTTLIGVLNEQLSSDRVIVARLVCTQLKADDLLKMVGYEFGIASEARDKGELLQQLGARLKAWDREGRRALLIVDEAQNLTVTALEELRLLTNIEAQGRPLLQIFLLGQPELRQLILRPELEQVHQRLVAATHLEPLAKEETEAYIKHRLASVDWQGNPAISKAVYPLIYKFSEGIPRRINLICSRLFLHGAVEQRDRIGVADVRAVIKELQSEGLAAGNLFSERDFDAVDEFEAFLQPENSAAAQSVEGNQSAATATVAAPEDQVSDRSSTSTEPDLNDQSLGAAVARPPQEEEGAPPGLRNEEKKVFEIDTPAGSELSGSRAVANREVGGGPLQPRQTAVALRVVPDIPPRPVQEEAPVLNVATLLKEDQKKVVEKEQSLEKTDPEGRPAQFSSFEKTSAESRKSVEQERPPAVSGKDSEVREVDSAAHNPQHAHMKASPSRGDDTATSTRKSGAGWLSESWVIAIFLLLSVALVIWAATGFKLPVSF